MADGERHQELQDHQPHAGQIHSGVSIHMRHQTEQQRRQQDAGKAGSRRGAHRARDVPLRDRGQRDRGLHCRRQRAQNSTPSKNVVWRVGSSHGQTQQMERGDVVGGGSSMQPIVCQARDHGFTRQPRALQEEQRSDRRDPRHVKDPALIPWQGSSVATMIVPTSAVTKASGRRCPIRQSDGMLASCFLLGRNRYALRVISAVNCDTPLNRGGSASRERADWQGKAGR